MLSVPRPEIQIVNGSSRGNQSVSQFDLVAFRVLPQVITGSFADHGVNGNAVNGVEKSAEDLVFIAAGAMPQLSHRDG